MEIVSALFLLFVLTLAIGFADRAISRARVKPLCGSSGAFPVPMPREQQWQRATSVVERSIERAAGMVAANGAAVRQL